MDSLLNIKTFVLVARYGGFSEAARQLDVVPSVVAKRIAQLEKALGTRLFERTTRTVRLTEAGEKLSARAGVLVASFEDLLQSVERDESRLAGHIRLVAPTTLTMLYLGQVLDDFLARHDRITLEIALQDDSVNPAERGFDLAISGRTASYEGVVEIPLCPTRVVACAAPAYLGDRGRPAHPAELSDHACLAFKPSGLNWAFQSARGLIHVDIAPRLLADDNMTLLRAAVAGLGIAILPLYIARNALASGALAPVLDGYPPQENWFKAYVPKRKRQVARVAALADWLSARLQAADWIDAVPAIADWHPQAPRRPGRQP
ncbi:LysR family transcriptional regulator [Noviherbaspirillum humi]|nr:LysR family transcriptional regulator [Noviherbaspirillum humi]